MGGLAFARVDILIEFVPMTNIGLYFPLHYSYTMNTIKVTYITRRGLQKTLGLSHYGPPFLSFYDLGIEIISRHCTWKQQ